MSRDELICIGGPHAGERWRSPNENELYIQAEQEFDDCICINPPDEEIIVIKLHRYVKGWRGDMPVWIYAGEESSGDKK